MARSLWRYAWVTLALIAVSFSWPWASDTNPCTWAFDNPSVTVYVDAGGVDSDTCGTLANPCETISGAMARNEAPPTATRNFIVAVNSGVYSGDKNCNLDIQGSIVASVTATTAPVINCHGEARFIAKADRVLNPFIISGLVIQNCSASYDNNLQTTKGGAMLLGSFGPFCIDQCLFQSNTAEWGGAIAALSIGTHNVIQDTVFDGNLAMDLPNLVPAYGGGIWFEVGSYTMVNTTFTNNSVINLEVLPDSVGGGGALSALLADIALDNCSFTCNVAVNGSGGAILVQNSYVSNSSFSYNSASLDGGAILSTDGGVFQGVTAWGNAAAGNGGAMAFTCEKARVVASASVVYGNVAGGLGGGIFVTRQDTDPPSSVGGVVLDCLVHSNSAGGGGGGLALVQGSASSLARSSILGNVAPQDAQVLCDASDLGDAAMCDSCILPTDISCSTCIEAGNGGCAVNVDETVCYSTATECTLPCVNGVQFWGSCQCLPDWTGASCNLLIEPTALNVWWVEGLIAYAAVLTVTVLGVVIVYAWHRRRLSRPLTSTERESIALVEKESDDDEDLEDSD